MRLGFYHIYITCELNHKYGVSVVNLYHKHIISIKYLYNHILYINI